ncbi:vacuolar cation/proton exchanger 3-like [Chenopodium quinoa]|uniref:vacuolar cation/proton exchanger 3-like n=1 Tax=Chenopodium quinoa TaxID=63459 RepID=UPI000B76EEB8|nr:vacuolar cation/proton exchanger 3-like [Chenopodium quinoa]
MDSSSRTQDAVWAGLENGGSKGTTATKEVVRPGRTAHTMSSSSLRRKSELQLINKVQCGLLKNILTNLQEVFLGTKLAVLFPAIPLAIAAHQYNFGREWVFALSLLALTPLAERVSFITEQIACYTGPTVGGLLNATCGNATELIIAILALSQNKVALVKYSLLGSILSNLLLVLGTSLFCGGLANLNKEQKYDRKQADVNCFLLLLGLLCHILPLLFNYSAKSVQDVSNSTLILSRVSSIVMLVAYFAYLVFQLWTHRQFFEAQEDSDDDAETSEEVPVIGFWSGFAWLVGMTAVIALLSEYVVATIETASVSWGVSVSFISIILLPIVGNAAEHAGAVIFAFKNKLDISLGVALGSATQISMFLVPLCVVVAWIMGIEMDLNFNTIETGCLALSIIVTAFTLQDGTSHYMKGLVLLLCYVVMGACFIVLRTPSS